MRKRTLRAYLHKAHISLDFYLTSGPRTPNTYGAFDEAVACIVEDVTGRESQFTLEKHGFEYRKHPTQLRLDDWEDQDKVRTVYYPETVEIIKKA
jgi:hypothetical protein